jgi:hypothetical protein
MEGEMLGTTLPSSTSEAPAAHGFQQPARSFGSDLERKEDKT